MPEYIGRLAAKSRYAGVRSQAKPTNDDHKVVPFPSMEPKLDAITAALADVSARLQALETSQPTYGPEPAAPVSGQSEPPEPVDLGPLTTRVAALAAEVAALRARKAPPPSAPPAYEFEVVRDVEGRMAKVRAKPNPSRAH